MDRPVVRQLDVADDPVFRRLRQAVAETGGEAWVVGGFVRDRLLDPTSDPEVDVTVVGSSAEALARRFAELVGAPPPAVFATFGTAQVTWGRRRLEFVSARRESYRDSSRKPEVESATLDEDLARRDFTVNALYSDLEGRVRDPFAGLADLAARRLRTPLDPGATFRDDPLRMLRGVRFAAALGFELAPDVGPAMASAADRLAPPVVSVERIAEELWKMLRSPRPRLALELLDRHGLLPRVLPELSATHDVRQGGYHEDDVFLHTLRTVQGTRPELTLRLAALFHDVGKPATAAGGGFHGHEEVGAELARTALGRLRLSASVTGVVVKLVRLHLRPVYYDHSWTDGAVRRLARAAGKDIWLLLELARADVRASSYPHPEKLEELRDRVRTVLEEQPDRFTLPLSGNDIMTVLGLGPGPEVGRIKGELEELVLDGVLPPDRQVLLDHLAGGSSGRGRGAAR